MEIKEIKKEDEKYPNQLKEIKNPPNKIFLVGNEKILQSDGIAVIGSRCNTEYGEKYATKFSKELAKQGLTIISGMAVGIDGFAHKGALSVGGKTIAVLGSGFNNIYPEENKELFDEIMKLSKDGITLPKKKDFSQNNISLLYEVLKRFGNYSNFAKKFNALLNKKYNLHYLGHINYKNNLQSY